MGRVDAVCMALFEGAKFAGGQVLSGSLQEDVPVAGIVRNGRESAPGSAADRKYNKYPPGHRGL